MGPQFVCEEANSSDDSLGERKCSCHATPPFRRILLRTSWNNDNEESEEEEEVPIRAAEWPTLPPWVQGKQGGCDQEGRQEAKKLSLSLKMKKHPIVF